MPPATKPGASSTCTPSKEKAIDSTRICNRCGQDLPIDLFAFKNKAKGVRQNRCRPCVKAYSREHYQANRQDYIDRAKVSNAELRGRKRALVQELRSRPCMDCGGSFPTCCMQFDHRKGRSITGRNSPETIANVTKSTTSLAALQAELEKCDVVCANCHAIRTHARRQAEWAEAAAAA
jgi:hypothetical protein